MLNNNLNKSKKNILIRKRMARILINILFKKALNQYKDKATSYLIERIKSFYPAETLKKIKKQEDFIRVKQQRLILGKIRQTLMGSCVTEQEFDLLKKQVLAKRRSDLIKKLTLVKLTKTTLKTKKNLKVKAVPKLNISKAAKPKRTVNITKTGSVKSAIEGVVFIDIPKEYTVFIGEEITISKNTNSDSKNSLKGMVIGLTIKAAEIMLFGDTSKVCPGDF
jgi:hypothetical protein